MTGLLLASPVRNRAGTASSCRTCPNRNDRRNVPSADGARVPVNNRLR